MDGMVLTAEYLEQNLSWCCSDCKNPYMDWCMILNYDVGRGTIGYCKVLFHHWPC
jgi:hypothetical protein